MLLAFKNAGLLVTISGIYLLSVLLLIRTSYVPSAKNQVGGDGNFDDPYKPSETEQMKLPISNSVFGFVRIQKTGSSALLSFLGISSGLLSWDNYLYSASQFVQDTRGSHSPFCVYGHGDGVPDTYFEHDPTDGPNPFGFHHPEQGFLKCSHSRYRSVVRNWERSKEYANYPAQNLSLQVFTMVRDPYERLRSLFYYVEQRTAEDFWKSLFLEDQYDRLRESDMEGWLSLLHKHDGYRHHASHEWRHAAVPYQFTMLNDSPEEAISMIQGDRPQVLVLLNECFEESLRFLEFKFNLAPGAADNFTDNKNFHANSNAAARENLSHEDTMRRRTKRWFYKDYKFYNASVDQFRFQIKSINLDRATLKNPCDLLWRQETQTAVSNDKKKR